MIEQRMFARFGAERQPRLELPEDWDWVKAWAKRWWIVETETIEYALELIVIAERSSLDPFKTLGRIIDCGRNGRGGLSREMAPSRLRRRKQRSETTQTA